MMAFITWIGIVMSVILVILAGIEGSITLGIVFAAFGFYCWSVLQEAIADDEES